MKTKQEFEAICDGIFVANNHLKTAEEIAAEAASEKIEILPGQPGTPERIAAYRERFTNRQPLFEE